jgi:hypothetical protein
VHILLIVIRGGKHEKISKNYRYTLFKQKNFWEKTITYFQVKVTLRLAVYLQSVYLGAKPFEARRNFFQLNPCGHINYEHHL